MIRVFQRLLAVIRLPTCALHILHEKQMYTSLSRYDTDNYTATIAKRETAALYTPWTMSSMSIDNR